MLGKLIHYEMKAVMRILLPVYATLLALAIIIGFTSHVDSGSNIVFLGALTLFSLVTFAAVLLTIYLLINRFRQNLLGNEGYFMFTLPVSTMEHILSKLIVSLLCMVLGILVVSGCGLVMGTLSMSITDMGKLISYLSRIILEMHITGEDIWGFVEILILLSVLATTFVCMVYSSISVGHLWSDHRTLGGVLAFIGFSILGTLISGPLCLTEDWQVLLYFIAWIFFFSGISWYILDRRLNLE